MMMIRQQSDDDDYDDVLTNISSGMTLINT